MDSRVGTTFGKYTISRLLGKGGMGEVYEAYDADKGRTVALKILAWHDPDGSDFRERFLRESRFAASLDHPNIVPIYEAGEADGLLLGADAVGFLSRRWADAFVACCVQVLGAERVEGGVRHDGRTTRGAHYHEQRADSRQRGQRHRHSSTRDSREGRAATTLARDHPHTATRG